MYNNEKLQGMLHAYLETCAMHQLSVLKYIDGYVSWVWLYLVQVVTELLNFK